MKGIINIRHLIDEQDKHNLETIESYYRFINDYNTCKRKRLKINKETTKLYNQLYQRFMDQTFFDKINQNGQLNQNIIEMKFLQLNSLIYQYNGQHEFESINDITQQNQILQEDNLKKLLQLQMTQGFKLLESCNQKCKYQLLDKLEDAVDPLKQGLDQIKQLKQYYDNHPLQITQSDKEWLFQFEKNFLKTLSNLYDDLGQRATCIEYQDKTLQLIKDYEGISLDYFFTLQNFNNTMNHSIQDNSRQLKKLVQIFKRMKLKVLYCLNQLNKQEYDQIIQLHQEVSIIDDDFQTAFYSTILICSIRLKLYSDINQWIDLMFSCISIITDNQLDMVISLRQSLYEEFLDRQFHHNKDIYEKTMLYYKEKTHQFFEEIQKQFSENYFNLKANHQRELEEQMFKILRGYLICSILCNDISEIRSQLQHTFKQFLTNPKYGKSIMLMYEQLSRTQNIPPQVETQLGKYISQLAYQKYL